LADKIGLRRVATQNEINPEGIASGSNVMQPRCGRKLVWTLTQRSRWCGNAGLNDSIPLGLVAGGKNPAKGSLGWTNGAKGVLMFFTKGKNEHRSQM